MPEQVSTTPAPQVSTSSKFHGFSHLVLFLLTISVAIVVIWATIKLYNESHSTWIAVILPAAIISTPALINVFTRK